MFSGFEDQQAPPKFSSSHEILLALGVFWVSLLPWNIISFGCFFGFCSSLKVYYRLWVFWICGSTLEACLPILLYVFLGFAPPPKHIISFGFFGFVTPPLKHVHPPQSILSALGGFAPPSKYIIDCILSGCFGCFLHFKINKHLPHIIGLVCYPKPILLYGSSPEILGLSSRGGHMTSFWSIVRFGPKLSRFRPFLKGNFWEKDWVNWPYKA